MARTREIKKRMNAVGTIQRITKTMQMIATAKFTAALQRAEETRPYAQIVRKLVAEVASDPEITHPLITGPSEKTGRELLLVISSDRGLCGAYNGQVLRHALKHLRRLQRTRTNAVLHAVGKKAVGFFRFQKITIDERMTFGDKPAYEQVNDLAMRYMEEFTKGEYDAVRVAYMQFVSNTRQRPNLVQLLPLKPDGSADGARPGTPGSKPADSEVQAGASASYEFSPSRDAILDELLPMAVKTTLFQAFNDAVVSEHIMRMVAMKAATDNAKQLRQSLRRQFNRARQTQITTELMEVISGSAALE